MATNISNTARTSPTFEVPAAPTTDPPRTPVAAEPAAPPSSFVPGRSPIESVVPIADIRPSAPVDPKVVARINEISSLALAAVGGQGKNVVMSVANILDAIAPVALSLLPAADDTGAMKELKSTSLATLKKDLGGAHLKDQEFIHQLQVIHAQLAQFKDTITMGNEIIVDSGSRLRAGVKEAVASGFGATVHSEPMKSSPEAAARAISDRIEAATTAYETKDNGEKTKVMDGLKDVVKPDVVAGLDAGSVSTLVAVLGWRHIFDKAETKKEDVTGSSGATKKDLMTLHTGPRRNPATGETDEVPKLGAAEKDGFVFVKLPYDDKLSPSGPDTHEPPVRIYRIVGAPEVGGSSRETQLARLLPSLATHDPLSLAYHDRSGTVTLARVQAEGEADPVELLTKAGLNVGDWKFPLTEGDPLSFTRGVHRGAAADTEKRSVVQFATFAGFESLSISMTPPFQLRTDVPYYNAIVVNLAGPDGKKVPLKVAEWTVEDFKTVKDPAPEA